jgi:hypothetical protein
MALKIPLEKVTQAIETLSERKANLAARRLKDAIETRRSGGEVRIPEKLRASVEEIEPGLLTI